MDHFDRWITSAIEMVFEVRRSHTLSGRLRRVEPADPGAGRLRIEIDD